MRATAQLILQNSEELIRILLLAWVDRLAMEANKLHELVGSVELFGAQKQVRK